jgi:hypothetical protein
MARGGSAGSLDEQFEPLILEGIGMDPYGAKPCTDVLTGLLHGVAGKHGPLASRNRQ